MDLDGGMGLAKSRAGASKESLRAQVNTLRGKIAELRRYPVMKQDSTDVGWLADPEAQAQVSEVSPALSTFPVYNTWVYRTRMGTDVY